MPRHTRTAVAGLASALTLIGCSAPSTADAPSPSPTALSQEQLDLEGLRVGFVEGLVATAPRITEAQADCAFDEAVANGVTFDDFIAIETSPALESKFAAAFRACGIS